MKDKFEEKKAANQNSDQESQKTEDQLFYEVVGGWNVKGRVFGLGATTSTYYEKPTLEQRGSNNSQREYVTSLKSQAQELELEKESKRKN